MGKTRQKANLTSDNLITSNINTDRIGINSSSPISTLDVGGNVNVTGVVTSTGGFNIGISSAGNSITNGNSIKTLNFIGAGNTFSLSGTTINISIAGGGGAVGGGGSIGIQSGGTLIGTGITTINFIGVGITASVNGTTGLVSIPNTVKTNSRSIATNSQTTFNVTYSVGYLDVYLNGIKLDTTEFTATDGTSVILTEGASENDVLEFITFTNLSLSSGTVVVNDTTTNSTRYLTHTEAISGGIGSIRISSTKLTFNPGTNTFSTGNIVGTSLSVTQTRIQSAAEKLVRVDGNSVNINFTTSGSNIGLCTNPTGNITLNVNGIPTDSSFDNHSLLFSVVVIQTGTARTCNAVTLNGVSRTIRWPGGTVGSGATIGYDIFNFIGINTIGSASTTANYEVLGMVNGGFR